MPSFLSHLTLSYLLEVIFRAEENQIFYINCTVVMQGFFFEGNRGVRVSLLET